MLNFNIRKGSSRSVANQGRYLLKLRKLLENRSRSVPNSSKSRRDFQGPYFKRQGRCGGVIKRFLKRLLFSFNTNDVRNVFRIGAQLEYLI